MNIHDSMSTLYHYNNVLVKQDKKNKLSTPFNPNMYKVTGINGSMITATNEDHQITRNSSFFKKLVTNEKMEQKVEYSDSLDNWNMSDDLKVPEPEPNASTENPPISKHEALTSLPLRRSL